MSILDHFKRGGFADPSTLLGALLYAIVFAFLAWVVGRALRLSVQRVLAHDKHDRFDLMAVRFLAKLVRYGVYIFAFVSYAHFVPALSGLGTADNSGPEGRPPYRIRKDPVMKASLAGAGQPFPVSGDEQLVSRSSSRACSRLPFRVWRFRPSSQPSSQP